MYYYKSYFRDLYFSGVKFAVEIPLQTGQNVCKSNKLVNHNVKQGND